MRCKVRQSSKSAQAYLQASSKEDNQEAALVEFKVQTDINVECES